MSRVANSIDKPALNDVMFVQVIGVGQEYCGRIFSQPIYFVMAPFDWSTSSVRFSFMQFWKELRSESTVKALDGLNSAFSGEIRQIP